MTGGGWCPRCGEPLLPGSRLPCAMCWDGRADAPLLEHLVQLTLGDGPEVGQAQSFLSTVRDPHAAPRLRALLASESGLLRWAALGALGGSGDATDAAAIAAFLADPSPNQRLMAIGALGELGGAAAADALAGFLAALARSGDSGELRTAVLALGRLGDPRAADPAVRLTDAAVRTGAAPAQPELLAVALRLGDDASARALGATLAEACSGRAGPQARVAAYRTADTFLKVVAVDRPGLLAESVEALVAASGDPVWRHLLPPAAGASADPDPIPAPVGPVPRDAFRYLDGPPPAGSTPATRFGGQPEWRGAPAWPHTTDGRPLTFFGQIDLGPGDGRTAYVFVDRDGDSFTPLGDGNALVLQPGPPPAHIACEPLAAGPGLFEHDDHDRPLVRRQPVRQRVERWAELVPGREPEAWTDEHDEHTFLPADEHATWNKRGGSPRFLQWPETPPGDGWRFAFQFTAGLAGIDLGDGAECYGFVREDGAGAFLWQCH